MFGNKQNLFCYNLMVLTRYFVVMEVQCFTMYKNCHYTCNE